MLRYVVFIFLALICILAACTSDCVYKLYNTSDGSELCGRFCPMTDAEGNTVVDDNGDVVYDKPEPVDKTNCILPSSTRTSSSSASSVATTN